MRTALRLHPDCQCAALTGVDVEIAWPNPAELTLLYVASGDIGALKLPPAAAPARTDELWKHTCFEAFLRPWPDDAYREWNFAPSSAWAAYDFTGYRAGAQVTAEAETPHIKVHTSPERYELQVTLRLPLVGQAAWRLGLSAVIELADGEKSYWALAHPPGKPDFHHADCFALELPAPEHT